MAVFCFYFSFNGDKVFAQTAGVVSQADPNSELLQGVQVIEQPLGLPATDIRQIIANIIRIALGLVGIVLVVIIIYGGFLWMTAGGNEEQIGKAKKVLTNAVIGLVIILSAYAIVLFVMRMLGIGVGAPSGVGIAPPGVQNFTGSGALGRVVKDHYPTRGQIDVPRNTKIIVTFFKPIVVDGSWVADTNGNGIFGDCLASSYSGWTWEKDCDALKLDNNYINIAQVTPSSTGLAAETPIRGANLLISKSADASGVEGIYTIVIRPYDYLGSDTEKLKYKVRLGNNIKRDAPNNPGIFANNPGSKFYEWNFTCSTELDLIPPHVTDVYPYAGSTEVKNTVLQISFNEPMDPIGVQGMFATDTAYGYYYLQNGFVYLKSDNSTKPLGGFNLVNNYQTLEFTPSIPCGTNACGGTIYCLPVCDKAGTKCNLDNYQLLLKAAVTIGNGTFESQPLSGIADICGNALDGNNDGKIDTAPNAEPVYDNGKAPDNYWWGFGIENKMDLIPPYLNQIIPGPEASWVSAGEDWSMWFSKRMRIDPMYTITAEESPTPAERCVYYKLGDACVLDLLWQVPFVTFVSSTPPTPPITRTSMRHGPFLDGTPQGYIPLVSSAVEDAHFNCMYPGQGPIGGENYDTDKTSEFCDPVSEKCCIKDGTAVFCCNATAQKENDSALCSQNLNMAPQK
ncbi:MAG: hypothetical protein PHD72_04370 [Patescibacteria group bacterium]|nr:hypothetical protein [Patescibacteria group bacterium]